MGFKIKGDTLIRYEDEPGVTQAVIPKNVRTIATNAFDENGITSVVIPDSVKKISSEAFSYCEKLVKVVLPKKNITIEKYAFFYTFGFTANLSIRDWDPAFGLIKELYARNYMNSYNANDPYYELFHEENNRYIRSHLDRIISTLDSSDIGAVIYLTREKMLSLYRTNRLLDMMSGNIEGTALLLDYKHNTFPAEYLERYERENTEKELGLRERSLAEWRRSFKLVSDGSGGWAIAKYRGTDATIVIPEKINNKPVTKIMSNAFGSSEDHNCTIEEVILPDSITVIEDGAFECCYELKSITLSSNLKKIGIAAFYSTGLTSVAIPDSVTIIENFTFNDCDALEKVVLPDDLKKIGQSAFSGCAKLAAITLPEGLSEIHSYAFKDCGNLTEIVIPSHITYIPAGLFSGCESLEKVTLPCSLESIQEFAFYECSSLAAVNIPNGVTRIQDSAFEDCSALTSVTLPDSLISLGDFAFDGCTTLADITIPQSLSSFGYDCFENTAWMDDQTNDFVIGGKGVLIKYTGSDREVTIPAGIAKIGEAAFEDNADITAVTIPEGVVEIGYEAFCDCCFLEYVTLPQSLRIIGPDAFGRTALSEIDIPKGVAIIGERAFSNTRLRSVTIPSSVREIGFLAFDECKQLAEIDLPEDLPIIDACAFDNTLYLENLPGDYLIFGNTLYRYKGKSPKVIIPDNIRVIGKMAFWANPFVTGIVVPDSVTEIEEEAFGNCRNLKSIILPDTLTKLFPFDLRYYIKTLKVRYKGNIYGYNDRRNNLSKLSDLINSEDSK